MITDDNVLVCLPVYNEIKYIEKVLTDVCKKAKNILIIDDGSTDGTTEILRRYHGIFKLFHTENLGYGRTIIDGFKYASLHRYEWIITMDCDLQHQPERLTDFYAQIQTDNADVISGSRYLHYNAKPEIVPDDRYNINKMITEILNLDLNLKLTDSFCGFKAYRTIAIEKLNLDENGYAFPLQFWVQAAQADLKIVELPVDLIYIDPARCFGQNLDDPEKRLNHYIDTIEKNTKIINKEYSVGSQVYLEG